MAETSKGSLSSQSGTTPTGNGVSGGGESGFHPQQMHQQFTYRSKFQNPSGLHQQRPVMVPYEQHSVSQQQGPYAAHHAPYQQLPHQQQQHLQQQLQYQQQLLQQLHQQQQMQFQQPENLHQSMPYIQDTQKSLNQSPQDLKSPDFETQDSVSPIRPTTTAVKPDTCTSDEPAKEPTQTPEQVEKLTKELEAQRTAHEKQVKELEALIKSLQEQKSQKEVKYLRVKRSSTQKKSQENKSQETKTTRRRSTLDVNKDEVMDTHEGPEEGDVFDSCPSPALSLHSNVSIKEEPVDDNPTLTIQGMFPQDSDDEEDSKANINKESKSGPENKPTKTYTLSVTDFDFCIFCQSQTKSERKMIHVTEDNLGTIQNIVLNVDCEASQRLKDYVLDIDMFLNNLPQYHSYCQIRLKCKLQNMRKKRKTLQETDFSLCIFCQEHRSESSYSFTNKGFVGFLHDLNILDDEMIEKLKKLFNFDRIKNVVEVESSKDGFSPNKFKIHKCCRLKFKIQRREKKRQKLSTTEPENKEVSEQGIKEDSEQGIKEGSEQGIKEGSELENEEDNVEITPDEEILELLAKRKKKIEEEKLRKQRKELPEPNEFDFKSKCILCGTSSQNRGKFRSIKNTAIQKTRDKADKNQHYDIIKILEHAVDFDIELLCHFRCFTNYNYNDDIRVKKGTYEHYEMAFRPIIKEIEEPMFRNGKVFSLVDLREKFLKNLEEFKIESEHKIPAFVKRIKRYYTFNNKCRVCVVPYPDYFIYSNHLSESQVAPQIIRLKKEKENECNENLPFLEQADSNKDTVKSEIKKKWRFSCTECGYKCFKKIAFKNHIKKHDLLSIEEIIRSKQVMCEICGKILKNKDCMRIHMRMHSGEKYSCSQCDRTYFSKTSLDNHALIHTGEKNKECPDCGKKFFSKQNLNTHIKKVHVSKTAERQFLCSVCGKGFRAKDRLKEHSRKHSDERPFVCKECGKSFKYHSNMRTHLMAHKGKKPQMCSICSFGCYTKANLKVHMAKHTGSNEQIMCSNTEKENEKSFSEKYIYLDEIPNIKTQTYFPL